ncbi:MAG: hypothetical protein SCK28_10125 [Bacillota bacterium]|nr:hypothetical protein [Bacillota bacterium]
MVIFVFLLLLVVLYVYLIRRIIQEGKTSYLIPLFFAIAVKIGAIIYLIMNAPVQ